MSCNCLMKWILQLKRRLNWCRFSAGNVLDCCLNLCVYLCIRISSEQKIVFGTCHTILFLVNCMQPRHPYSVQLSHAQMLSTDSLGWPASLAISTYLQSPITRPWILRVLVISVVVASTGHPARTFTVTCAHMETMKI